MDLSSYTNRQLKAVLHELKGKTSGSKQELVLRLQSYVADDVQDAIERALQDDLVNLNCTINENGEDIVTKLQGEVATLNTTVQMLVEKLQLLIPGTASTAAVTESLPQVGANVSVQVPQTNEQSNDTGEDAFSGRQTNANVVGGQSSLSGVWGTHGQETVNENATAVLSQTGRYGTRGVIQMPVVQPRRLNCVNNLSHGHTTREVLAEDIGGDRFGHALNRGFDTGYTPTNRNDITPTTTSRGYSDIRDLTRLMPEFYPGRGISARIFIERIEQLSRAYGWNDQMLIYAVYDQLKGPAKHWLNAMPVFHLWSDFVRAFLADFPTIVNSAELNMKMMRSKMNRSESYSDYFYRMLLLGRSGDMADAAIITYMVNGLYDDTLRKILSAMHFANCADLLVTLTNLNYNKEKPQTLSSTNVPENKSATQMYNKPKPSTSGFVCYRCHERGHISKDCPKVRRKPEDHINNIHRDAQEGKFEAEVTEINNISPGSNITELLQKIHIVGSKQIQCMALIDSGSGKSLIKRSVAERSGIPMSKCKNKLVGFAGDAVECFDKIIAEIQFNESSHCAELLVIEDDKMPYDAIVGIER